MNFDVANLAGLVVVGAAVVAVLRFVVAKADKAELEELNSEVARLRTEKIDQKDCEAHFGQMREEINVLEKDSVALRSNIENLKVMTDRFLKEIDRRLERIEQKLDALSKLGV